VFKEISIGFGLATIISLIVMGYDITPFIFLIAAGAGLFYLARARGMVSTKNFKSSSGFSQGDDLLRTINAV
jgi:cell division protease FtsH